jgi:hypothetical protein
MEYLVYNNLIEKILKEAKQRGTLYHYTDYDHLTKIIESNILKPLHTTILGKERYTVSTTRDKNFHEPEREIQGTSIRLELNGDKISENYKILPYNYFTQENNYYFNSSNNPARPKDTESEEAIITTEKGLINVKKYIELVTIFPDKEKNAYAAKRTFEIVEFLNLNNIPYYYEEFWQDTINQYKEEANAEKLINEALSFNNENKEDVLKAIKEIEKSCYVNPFGNGLVLKDNSAMLDIEYFDNTLWISSIFSMQKGGGTKAMNLICKAADMYGVECRLVAKPFGTKEGMLTAPQLVKWYKNFGFKTIRFGEMKRAPKNIN